MNKEELFNLLEIDGKLISKRCTEKYTRELGVYDFIINNAPGDFETINDKIRYLKYGGGYCKVCGVRTNVHVSGVGYSEYCKEHFHEPKKGKLAHNKKDVDVQRVIELYEQGLAITDIAQKLGNVTNVTITKHLRSAGYELRSHSENQKMQSSKKRVVANTYGKEYLNESKLVQFCKELWPEDEYITNKTLKEINSTWRPDYVNLTKKIIVEYDGYKHYTSANTVDVDEQKDATWKQHGYTVIRWPYFVQLSKESVKLYFGIEKEVTQVYPHGFIDERVVYPADFCVSGLYRFMRELTLLRQCGITQEIYKSIDDAIRTKALANIRSIWPDQYSVKMISRLIEETTDENNNFFNPYDR